MSILCTICARSGSKGVPNKNIKILSGKPLLAYTINYAKDSGLFDFIVVSTDSKGIRDLSCKLGVESWFLRPKNLSLDSSPKIPVIRHALKESESKFKREFKTIVDLDVTSPLRNKEDLTKCLESFNRGNFDNMITGSASRRNPYFNMIEIGDSGIPVLSKRLENVPKSRQKAPKVFDLNASIYIWKREVLIREDNLITPNTGFYEMPEERSFDIDSSLDWMIVEMIMKKNLNEKK